MKSKTYIVETTEQLNKLAFNMSQSRISKPLRITISVYHRNRTFAQNSLMWMWYEVMQGKIRESTGQFYSTDEIHEFMKGKLLPTRVVDIGGELKEVHKQTSDLNVQGMTEYLTALDEYCISVLGFELPKPDDYKYATGGKKE